MPSYKYAAKTAEGNRVTGTIRSGNRSMAMTELKNSYPIILSLVEANNVDSALNIEIGSKKVKNDALVLMCAQFYNMLRCGIQTATAVQLIADSTENKKLKKILLQVAAEVNGGRSLYEAFQLCAPKAFPPTFYETVKAGEDSGNVDEAFETLYHYFDKQGQVVKKIRSALIYPIFVVVVAVIVLIVVMTAVVPPLAEAFAEFETALPFVTRLLIGLSNLFVNHWLIMLAVLAAIIGGYIFAKHTEKGAYAIDMAKLSMPVIGKINTLEASSQFATTLSMLLGSGLPVVQALEILSRVFKNKVYQVNTEEIAREVKQGYPIGACMAKKKIFLPTLVNMVDNGDRSGNLGEMLGSIGEYFSNETDIAVKNALARLEPTLLVIVAAFAGFLVVSIYIPMFTLYGLF